MASPEEVAGIAPAVAEHPDAHKMRRQVEFYFSDENLPKDLHMLKCCDGRNNEPVSLSRICGFRKMREWKQKDVVAALRNSTFLDVTPDGKRVSRKVPLTGPCLLDENFGSAGGEDDGIAYDPRSKREIAQPVAKLPQTKKVYPPGTSKNMLKPTGFEDTHMEGPMTPQEAEEELAMYDPDKPFVERIEIAIQRFRQKRRMHEMYSKVFGKWMKFGGVEHEPRMFGGMDKAAMKDMTSEEIARATATYVVPWDREESDKWAVDFLGTAEAFLSSYYPANLGQMSPTQVKTSCQVLRSFYNYLLFHSVCDEHKDSIIAARSICDTAEVELPQTFRAGEKLPGAFNVAASIIFHGSHVNSYTGLSAWATEEEGDWKATRVDTTGMRNEAARITLMTGVAAYGTDEQYDCMHNKIGATLEGHKFIASEHTGLEVVAIDKSTSEVQAAYAQQNKAWKRKIQLQPLGKLICKKWYQADFKEYDLPPSKVREIKDKRDKDKQYEFWVEDEALDECFVGMKIDATVLTLESGIMILDEVKQVMCSFYKWIPNDLWAERKPPKLRIMKKWLDESERNREDGEVGEGGNGAGEKGLENADQMDEGDMSDDFEEE